MCDKAILENGGTLMFVPNRYRNQKNCSKVFDGYAHALGFVPDYYKTQKVCNKAVNTFAIQFLPDQNKTHKVCVKAVNNCPFVFNYVPD